MPIVMPVAGGYPRVAELVARCPGAERIRMFADGPGSPDELADRVRGAAIVVHFFHAPPLDTAVLVAQRPRQVVVAGPAGTVVDVATLSAAGIDVYDTPGLAADTVAEFTVGLMLALSRRLTEAVRDGGWHPVAGRDLAGRTVGVVGWGRIGARVARLAVALGCQVAAWSPSLDDATADAAGVRRTALDALLTESDIVSLHLRSVPQTAGIIDAHRLGLMRPDAVLVNTARAGLLDMVALRERLRAGRLGGVALDVYDIEPLPPDDVLRSQPNAILTPHMAWMTDDAVTRFLAAALAWAVFADARLVRKLS
jgi:phosphoglycerate dehydrogenase-like enzyme